MRCNFVISKNKGQFAIFEDLLGSIWKFEDKMKNLKIYTNEEIQNS